MRNTVDSADYRCYSGQGDVKGQPMPTRYRDWFRQSVRDLEHARHALKDGDYEWACFAAQQATEKAVKAVYQRIGADAWGHASSILLANLPAELQPGDTLLDKAKELDKHYITSRYPNFHPSGAPFDYYTEGEAERAIDYAQELIAFCENKLL